MALCFALFARPNFEIASRIWKASPRLLTFGAAWLVATALIDSSDRASGWYERPTQLAFAAFLMILLAIECHFKRHLSRIIVIALLSYCIYLSGTKKELMVALLAMFWVFNSTIGRRNSSLILLCAVPLLGALDFSSLADRLRLDQPVQEMGSRIFLIRAGLEQLWSGTIWGIGPGQVDAVLPETIGGSEFGGFHNGPLDMLVQYGLWSGLPYVLYIAVVFRLGTYSKASGKFLLLYFIVLEIFSGPILYGGDFRAVLLILLLSSCGRSFTKAGTQPTQPTLQQELYRGNRTITR